MPRPVTVIDSNVTNAVHQVMDAMQAPVYFETYIIKGKNMNHLTWEVVDSIRKNKVCLNGRVNNSLCGGARKELDLFASLVDCFNLNGQPSRHENVDIVVIRENTEGEYAGREHEVVPGVIESFQVTMTKFWSDRIAKYAFEYAHFSKRKKVTAVHNNGKYEKLADAFFLESCQEVAKMYPNITYNEIASRETRAIRRHSNSKSLWAIIANIASGVAGGSFGDDYAIFEQVGSVGNHKNPVALLFSSVMMLRHLLLPLFADRLKTAVTRVISEGKCGNSNTTTQEVVDSVIANLD
ncbi:Contains similarity to NAD+ dependent isocitrate dehydrogenase subunit 1 from Arabidopsis thaliana gb/U81993. It contains an isocitrate and isopropylmalate dehydrogenases domain PF/00180 [Arabidopsis thaliana]|uniref:Putative isocitrate dehydrogenase [NAD] subunit-like 4 n=1 Tax=Arabidopsis thaliana TaxID=3702 RepID=IDH4_ARATH|nr:PUTATIVE PSEUDOGENE: RecName: Full=Putative isocitrate dehydrogenase [NAD] subunit-like 4; AltName: Full=IDH-IV; AltName: Full=Isocitric dehydrogenase-like protein 4; AltName: Full=NAD(+)-specific ICDH 4 [Arabidopsis thaliana]AAF81346.1 Contains similarity to NAD+ dependent isocitrate dehydrogenase subunit 1 from Arabidopsis thaliana gb/U81993. It contains an isocitrate and isopropylmalate dehydrogenases domain PF/00180 [Arabidopsis thaliana]